jgi:hypothetical protein
MGHTPPEFFLALAWQKKIKHFKTIIKIVPRHVKAKVSKHSYRNVSGSQKRGKIDVAKCIKEGQMVVAMPKN